MAKHQLQTEGATGVNKRHKNHGVNTPSFFSTNWKKYTIKASKIKKGGKK